MQNALGSGLNNLIENEDFLTHLNKYNVIHLDISSFTDFYKDNLVEKILENVYREMKLECPDIIEEINPIGTILMDVYNKTGIPFIIIIDEWDCVIRNQADRQDLVHEYLQFLHSLFKSEESKKYLALVYITGILPIKKVQDESALNNFMASSMIVSLQKKVFQSVKNMISKYRYKVLLSIGRRNRRII